ncbi:hypothetical protein IW262DRAFT_141280 [Armillaria fumosa]|nr:hypothetical protein IW262DRAFT_141280 [Armillaria fumosa]
MQVFMQQALAVLILCVTFCAALPGPIVDVRQTVATCAPTAEPFCCARLMMDEDNSYIGLDCKPLPLGRPCSTSSVCCTGDFAIAQSIICPCQLL